MLLGPYSAVEKPFFGFQINTLLPREVAGKVLKQLRGNRA
jgi:hypothetical protein